MYIDTHTHLSYNYGIKPEEYVLNAINSNVNKIIVSCCDKESILEGLELLKKFDNIYLTIGFHPDETGKIIDSDIIWLEKIIKNDKRIIGIGEIGLDYHFVKDNKEQQKELFIKQLNLAQKLNLPVVVHTRDSIQDTYDILKKYNLKGDIHCFSGSIEMANNFIKLGYYLGIGGVVTFSNSNLYKVVENIGLDNIILETDSPYLSPDRGKINESKNIPIIAEKIASILDTNIENVQIKTTENACKLFDLK